MLTNCGHLLLGGWQIFFLLSSILRDNSLRLSIDAIVRALITALPAQMELLIYYQFAASTAITFNIQFYDVFSGPRVGRGTTCVPIQYGGQGSR